MHNTADNLSIGGDGPCVILKATGRAINMVDYMQDYSGKEIRNIPLTPR